jgi:hypothetical protein
MGRDISKLQPEVRLVSKMLKDRCAAEGLSIMITDCWRTKAEQNGIGSSRTKAKYPSSYHNWGLAFDFCRLEDVDKDGKISDDAYNEKGDFFRKVGEIGKSLGLEWGGDWTSIVDKPHFQYTGFGTWSQILKTYGTPEKWAATWTPIKPKKTVTQRSSVINIIWLQENLNNALWEVQGFELLDPDGKYGPKTKNAVLLFWKQQGWNKDGKDTGWRAGAKTIQKLSELAI